MAQYIGPAALPFLPQPTRATEVTNVTTMPAAPTTTAISELFPQVATPPQGPTAGPGAPAEGSIYLPIPEKKAQRKFVAACTAIALRAGRIAVRYRLELTPAALVGTLTGLGWWQHLTGPIFWPTAGIAALAAAGAAVAGYGGVKHSHPLLLNGGAGVAIAAGDVAAAVGAGPGVVSLTVSAIGTGLAYAAWTPWLIQHRKDQKQLAPATAPAVTNGAATNGTLPATFAKTPEELEAEAAAYRAANSPFHHDVIPYCDDDSDDITVPIRIGWDELGAPVLLKMLYRHTLVAGASDWGKSGIINLIIKKLLRKRHVELFGIDMKPGAMELGPWEPKMKRLARGPEEARDLLQMIRAECDRRGALLEDLSKRSMAAGREPVRKWIPGVHGTAWFVITDELAELIRQDEELRKEEAAAAKGDPDAAPPEQPAATTYQSLLALARSFGIQFISATQQPSAKVFGGDTDARGNYGNRISTRVGEAGHTQFIFGTGWKAAGFTPNTLTRPGEFYIGSPEMPLTDPPKCRAEYVDDVDIAVDVAHLHSGFRPSAPVGRFAPQGEQRPQMRMVKAPQQTFPDGTTVGRDDWPDLYRAFCDLCEQQGSATKEELTEAGPFASRDTARRALDAWLAHGVQVRKAGRAERFYLPDTPDLDD